jgi:ubiquinone/menaquinone biosynthesis C-methylase UbiE
MNEGSRDRRATVFLALGLLALPLADASVVGIVAFYAIVHFSTPELSRVFSEMHRVLRPMGLVLLSFHIGREVVKVTDFLGMGVQLDFVFHPVAVVATELEATGFTEIEVVERDPYPNVEYPSRRAYVFARKGTSS